MTDQPGSPASVHDPLRTFSFGGGVQSMAALVLASQRRIDFRTFLFANVGDDSEHPDTLDYLRTFAHPFAERHGLQLVEIQRITRTGAVETIRSRIGRADRKSQVIPVRSTTDGPPMSRSCTVDFKIEVIGKWLKAHGATEANKATVAIGISLDEIHRANRKPRPYEDIVYPLLDMPTGEGVGEPLRRTDCERIIRDAGLPVPPKSSCYFCPFHSLGEWTRQRRDEPELFAKSVEIEREISAKAGSPRYLTRYGAPLIEVVPEGSELLPFVTDDDEGRCDLGVCFT